METNTICSDRCESDQGHTEKVVFSSAIAKLYAYDKQFGGNVNQQPASAIMCLCGARSSAIHASRACDSVHLAVTEGHFTY